MTDWICLVAGSMHSGFVITRESPRKPRYPHLPLVITALLAGAALYHGPIAQPAAYHDFAAQQLAFGIAHDADVVSNLGFALVALGGCIRLAPASRHPRLRAGWAGYRVFLIGLLAGAWGDVSGEVRSEPSRALAAWLALIAVASVGWWHYTELAGRGDLRPYLLLQGLLLIPLWQWIYQLPGADRRAFGAALALYVIAKFAELNDHEIAAVLGGVTGHTLKHLLATAAAALIVARLVARVRAPLAAK